MATYVLGDLHGCFRTLEALLGRIRFDPRADRLWLAGDLVNRGPRSLEVLRRARELAEKGKLTMVLGNHDLHLLARAAGVVGERKRDTLGEVLAAPDAPELLAWLRRQPLLYREGPFVLVHAGLHPAWDLPTAEALAREAEEALSEPGWEELLRLYKEGALPPWRPGLSASERRLWGLQGLTLLRTVDGDGGLDRDFAGVPQDVPPGRTPWFESPGPWSRGGRGGEGEGTTLLFGHWAALGVLKLPGLLCLDSGCAWEGRLTAFRLEDGALFQEPNRDLGAWR